MTAQHSNAKPLTLTINGQVLETRVDPDTPLLNFLRNDLGLNGPKYGCGLGQCGACTVLVDGQAARSCIIPLEGIQGRTIMTLEGLGTLDEPHLIQQAFIAEQAAQCGYCLNGMIMMTASLLARIPSPTEQEIRSELSANFCRCGTHIEIMRAVQRAAKMMRDVKHAQVTKDGI
jgi:nicotinate dehydrogenase subunit A